MIIMINKMLNVKLRSVEKKDWNFILQIRNEKEVRQACHNISIIPDEDHVNYMEKISKEPDCYQWIVTSKNIDIGYVKLIHGDFGYMIQNKFRGKGFGTPLYNEVFSKLKKLGIKKICGDIKINQIVPLKLALKVGFIQKDIIKKNNVQYYHVEKIISEY